jgi:hypothetical protein
MNLFTISRARTSYFQFFNFFQPIHEFHFSLLPSFSSLRYSISPLTFIICCCQLSSVRSKGSVSHHLHPRTHHTVHRSYTLLKFHRHNHAAFFFYSVCQPCNFYCSHFRAAPNQRRITASNGSCGRSDVRHCNTSEATEHIRSVRATAARVHRLVRNERF